MTTQVPAGLDWEVIEEVLTDVRTRFPFWNRPAKVAAAGRILAGKGFEFDRDEIAYVYDRM